MTPRLLSVYWFCLANKAKCCFTSLGNCFYFLLEVYLLVLGHWALFFIIHICLQQFVLISNMAHVLSLIITVSAKCCFSVAFLPLDFLSIYS